MRRVTGDAALGLHGSVFENEWTGFIGMTTEANLILRRGGAQLAREESAVRIVAVRARQQTFIHAMMNRLGKLRPYFKVASVTQHRLGHLQQSSFHFGMMSRVAVDTTDIVL